MSDGLFAHLFIYAAALAILPSTVAGVVVRVLAELSDSNPFSKFHHCLFVSAVWSVALMFGTTFKSLMSYNMAFGLLLILSTVAAFVASLFSWILMGGIIAFWRMLGNRVSS